MFLNSIKRNFINISSKVSRLEFTRNAGFGSGNRIVPKLLERDDQGFYIDTRRGQRESFEVQWQPKVPLKGPIRFEIADMEDIDLFTQFRAEVFANHCEFMIQSECKFEGLLPCFYACSTDMLADRLSYFVFDDDRLIALMANIYFDKESCAKIFPYGTGHDNPKLEMLDDYADVIASYDYGERSSNVNMAFCDESLARTGPFLPKDMKRLTTVDSLAVHPKYHSCGIGTVCFAESVKILEKFGTDYILGNCVADESYHICTTKVS